MTTINRLSIAFVALCAWNARAAVTEVDAATTGTRTVNAGETLMVSNTTDATLMFDLSGKGTFLKMGEGKLTVDKQQNSFGGMVKVREGTLAVTNAYAIGNAARNPFSLADMSFENGSTLEIATTSFWIGNQKTLVVTNANVVRSSALAKTADCAVNVNMYDGNSAVMKIYGDSHVTNKLVVGNKGCGSVYQYGGDVFAANNTVVGSNGYGYYELDDGKLSVDGYFCIAGYSAAKSTGVFVQHGGTFEVNRWEVLEGSKSSSFITSKKKSNSVSTDESRALFYLDGGTFTSACNLTFGESGKGAAPGGESQFVVADSAVATVAASSAVVLSSRTNHTAIVNVIDGGRLITGKIYRGYEGEDFRLAKSHVNINGGIIEIQQQGNGVLFSNGSSSTADEIKQRHVPDAVTIYEKGVTFDGGTAQQPAINASLRAPVGNGVKSITLPQEVLDHTYVGAPVIKISGGGGEAASAVALFDSKSGKVEGVRITSPGFGYTSVPTVKIYDGDKGLTEYEVAPQNILIAANSQTGGVTICGGRNFVLSQTNTFGGTLTLKAGQEGKSFSVTVALEEAIPEGCHVIVDGNNLKFADTVEKFTCGDFTMRSGSIALNYKKDNITYYRPIICDTLTIEDGNFGNSVSAITCNVFNVTKDWTGGGNYMNAIRCELIHAKGLGGSGVINVGNASYVDLSALATIRMTGADLDAGGFVMVQKQVVDLSKLTTIELVDAAALSNNRQYTLLKANDGLTGFDRSKVTVTGLKKPSLWNVSVSADGKELKLSPINGTVIIVR